jgi:hypothetical protein
MRKKIAIIIVALVAVIVAVGVYFAIRAALQSSRGSGVQEPGGILPPVATGTLPNQATTATSSFPAGNTFQIGTGQGVITVNNFYKTDAYITEDQQTVVLVENDNYTIVYNRDDSGFIIAFLSMQNSSLQALRAAAEADFLSQLGVSESDACKLNVDESVTDKTSADYGSAMGLSFCENPSAQ